MNCAKQDAHKEIRASPVISACCNRESIMVEQHDLRTSSLYSVSRSDGLLNDGLLENDLAGLSFEEQLRISKEVHGDASVVIVESKSFVDRHLQALTAEIGKIEGKSRVAYDRAKELDDKYVEDRAFRLMFLRADEFDAVKASQRMMKHFQYKLELFGENMLVKDIAFDDLSKDAQDCLYCGCFQFQETPDTKGRTVVYYFPDTRENFSWEDRVQARWYQYMVALKEDATQRHGVVFVVFLQRPLEMLPFFLKTSSVLHAVPFHPDATHFCVLNKAAGQMLKPFLSTMKKEFRLSILVHQEDKAVRILYVLQTFGIDPASVPLRDDGTPETSAWAKVLQRQRDAEKPTKMATVAPRDPVTSAHKDDSTGAIVPRTFDVLLGQGRRWQGRTGNRTLEELVQKELPAYKAASSQFAKTCVVARVVQHMNDLGTRFLRSEKMSNTWVEVEPSAAHNSVSSRFQNKVRAGKTRRVCAVGAADGADFSSVTATGRMGQLLRTDQICSDPTRPHELDKQFQLSNQSDIYHHQILNQEELQRERNQILLEEQMSLARLQLLEHLKSQPLRQQQQFLQNQMDGQLAAFAFSSLLNDGNEDIDEREKKRFKLNRSGH